MPAARKSSIKKPQITSPSVITTQNTLISPISNQQADLDFLIQQK
jgi:hypothetical protein